MTVTQTHRMTIDEVRAAIGGERAAWAETGNGRRVVLVSAGRNGDSVLVRDVAPRGGYFWTSAAMLERRADLDAGPEPVWLQQARMSPRPPAVLWDILDRVQVRYAQPQTNEELEAEDEFRKPQFDTDAEGRVL